MSGSIGIFDSGLGGLTVYKEVRSLLPKEDIIYFADTKRAPFGGKSKKTLLGYSTQIIDFLQAQQVKAIVVGCNTISSNNYPQLEQKYSIPLFELIQLAVNQAVLSAQRGVGVLATVATIKSGVFEKEISLLTRVPIYSRSCPLFVPLVEEGLTRSDIVIPVVKTYIDHMLPYIDTLVLGCTHYPFLIEAVQSAIGEHISIINPAGAVAKQVSDYLQKNGMAKENGIGKSTFYTTGDTSKFSELCHVLTGTYQTASQAIL